VTQERELADRDLLDPRNDGWASESLAEAAEARIKELGALLNEPSDVRLDRLASFVADDYGGTTLQPDTLDEAFRDSTVLVRRNNADRPLEAIQAGVTGLASAIDDLARVFAECPEVESHFKVVRVSAADRSVTTAVLVELSGTVAKRSTQVNAVWQCHWSRTATEELRLTSIHLDDYEEVVVRVPEGKWFADHTADILGNNESLRSQFAFGHHHWLQRIERVHRFDTAGRNGLAVGDVNGDGLDDLYVCQPAGLPNCLFVHSPDGTAVDRSAEAGVDWLDQTSSVLLCDLDNDGDQDLVLATPAGVLLMRNDSRGKFDLVTTLDLDYDVQSLSAVDYNNDGRLDLFACVYRTESPDTREPFLYRDASGGGRNRLFRSDIDGETWNFTDVTDDSGLDRGADRYSFAASWEDYDNDGDQDLYVANDFGRNFLYENRNGSFEDVSEKAGVLDIGSGMSVSWGDYNRDGLVDLYVGNMFSSAGQRVTTQAAFRPGEDESIRNVYQRLAKGNSLFANSGDGTFREVGAEAGVELGRWAWSSVFVDINNDGWEDVLVANGYITTEDTGDL
jgi:hypothetical protein